MHINLIPFVAVWIVLACSVLVLFVRRRLVASHEDDHLHVLQGGPIAQQFTVANQLDRIDKWGKILTAITAVFGLLVAAAYVYQFFVQSAQIPTGL
ncbi:MAG TPA: hypothetical protein VMH81_38005 [Bryobacteraceae bacterium]|nr:hypothetical protein [Bryobacteraceae bacterium]